MKQDKINNKILILSLLFIFIVGISAVSATSNDNNTLNEDSIEISTSNDVAVKDTLSVSQEDVVNDINDASFTDLNTTINSGGDIIELNQNYTYRYGDSQDGITIARDNIIIDGNGHSIDGNSKSKIFTITGNNVTLKNIILKNAFTDISYTLHNKEILNMFNGAAITWVGDNGKIINSQITDNNLNIVITKSPDYYTGNINVNVAGGIIWKGVNGSVVQSTFNNNDVNYDGEDITSSGAILWTGSNAVVSKSNFTSNNGALFIIGMNSLVSNSNFINEINGAISIDGENTNVLESTFINNTKDGSGAAIYMTSSNNNISECSFINNTCSNIGVANGGGAICIFGDNINIIKSNFINNSCPYWGGAIFMTGVNNVKIMDSNFTNNSIWQHISLIRGGAVYAGCNNFTLSNSIFINNHLSSINSATGGAIYMVSNGFIIDNSVFINNTANDDGHVRIEGNNGTISKSTFINSPRRAISIITGNNILISNSSFINHKGVGVSTAAYNTTIADSIFVNNSGGNAGAIQSNSAYNTIVNSTFINNTATSNGGAIIFNIVSGNVIDSIFINNTAKGYYGGAVWMKRGNISGSIFINNNVGHYGGAVALNSLNGQNSTLYDCVFMNNYAGEIGGGVLLQSNNSRVYNSIFINNPNSAIHIYHSDYVFIGYNTFINSTSTFNGIKTDGGSTHHIIEKNWFGSNTASYTPGSSHLIAKLEKVGTDNTLVAGEYNPIVKVVFYDNVTGQAVDEANIRLVNYTLNVTNIKFKGETTAESGKIFADNTVRQAFNITAKVDNQQLETLVFKDLILSTSNSFKDLQSIIEKAAPGETVTLSNNYAYNPQVENEPTVVLIDKNIKIIGNVNISASNKVEIFNITADDVEISGITFTNANGSAITISGNNVKLNDVKFINNIASGNGGAIYALANNIYINKAIFISNTAADGSAVYIIGNNTVIENCIFNKNHATLAGGVEVYIKGVNTKFNNVSLANTTNNAVKFEGDNLTVTDLTLDNVNGDGLTVIGNNSEVSGVNVNGGEGTVINIIGDNTNVSGVNSNEHSGDVVALNGNNTEVSNVVANNNTNGNIVKTEGTSTISNITANGGNGTVVNAKGDNTKVTGITANDYIGNIVKAEGNFVNITGVYADGGNGTMVTVKGDWATISDLNSNNYGGETIVVDGKGAKISEISAGEPKDIFTIPTNITGNSPTFIVHDLPVDATGYFVVEVDGKTYSMKIDNRGANITVENMTSGYHKVVLTYTGDDIYRLTNQTCNVTIPEPAPVAPVITLNASDISVEYSGSASYSVHVQADGVNVTDGENVTITFNGVKYTVKTVKGYAILALTTALKVDKYAVTAEYKNKTVSNNVIIKNIINANKLKKLKKSKKVNKVKISLLPVDGKVQVGKTIVLKLKNKKVASAKTNSKGVATLKVKKKSLKKFKKGKKVVATVVYGADTVTKKIKIA